LRTSPAIAAILEVPANDTKTSPAVAKTEPRP